MLKCVYCNKVLRGQQTKYCSPRCRKDEWKVNNIEKHRSYIKKSQQSKKYRRREYLAEVKSKPCEDCGIQYPWYVMEFDHVRGVKVRHVSLLTLFNTDKELLDEIAKCDVVCANCHRLRTYKNKWSKHTRVTI